MILIGYAAIVFALVWLARAEPGDGRFTLVARLAGLVVGLAAVAVALLLLSHRSATTLGDVVLALLALGGAVYVSGLLRWAAMSALQLRRAGWIAMVLALAVPTTLTLALPLLALLAPTLRFTHTEV